MSLIPVIGTQHMVDSWIAEANPWIEEATAYSTLSQAEFPTAVTTWIVSACVGAGGSRRELHVGSFSASLRIVLICLFSRCGGQTCSSGSLRNKGQELEPLEYEKGEHIYSSHSCHWSWDGREYELWGGNRHRKSVSHSRSELLRLMSWS